MAFCARDTIQKVKDALGGRPLDYILCTHTHYDHIGALPFFRQEWPQLRAVTCAAGAAVLLKPTPRRVIRELSVAAAQMLGAAVDTAYSDDAFRGDVIVQDGECISLGGLTAEVLETPGHTRDSLSFFMPEIAVLALNETTGVLAPDGSVYPGYLTSCADAINSIEKCRAVPYKYLSLPHRSIVSDAEADGFFDRALAVTNACRDFIKGMQEQGLSEDAMQEKFFERYGSDALLSFQPKDAFMANARATIACALREG